jgi:hypothetical protein
MAVFRITELEVASTPTGSELLLIRQGTRDKQVQLSALKDYVNTQIGGTYLNESSNLSDVANSNTAFNNIKVNGTTSYSGVLELATNAETITGTDTSRAVTPAGVAAVVGGLFDGSDQLLAQNGYQKFPGGLIIQWGRNTGGTYNFPIPFPNAAFSASAVGDYLSFDPEFTILSNSQFTIHSGLGNHTWIAIGH